MCNFAPRSLYTFEYHFGRSLAPKVVRCQENTTNHLNEQPGPENGLNQFTPFEKRIHASRFLLTNLPPRFPRVSLIPDFQTQSGDPGDSRSHHRSYTNNYKNGLPGKKQITANNHLN